MNHYKTGSLLLTSLLVLFLALGCSAPTEMPATEDTSETITSESDEMLELTVEELSYYDGKEGRPAYVAVEGIIYDVTDLPLWVDGIHQGVYTAGQDLTDEILNKSPHGTSVLDRAKKVGTLVENAE